MKETEYQYWCHATQYVTCSEAQADVWYSKFPR